jgi:hypothetical protein
MSAPAQRFDTTWIVGGPLTGALSRQRRVPSITLFLDKKNCLIADEVMGHGTVDHAPDYPREVALTTKYTKDAKGPSLAAADAATPPSWRPSCPWWSNPIARSAATPQAKRAPRCAGVSDIE